MKGRHGRYKLHGARSPTRGQHGPRRQRPSWVPSARGWQLRSSPRSVDWIFRPSSGFSSLAGAGGERRRDLERAGGVSVGVRGGRENSVPPHFASNLRGIPPTFYGEHAASARAMWISKRSRASGFRPVKAGGQVGVAMRPSAAGTPEGRAERSLDDVDDLLQRSVGGREVLGRGVPSSVHDRIAVATSVGSEREPKPVPAVGPLSAESTRTPLARSSRSMAIDAAWRAVLLDA